jgi:hypothetical protein
MCETMWSLASPRAKRISGPKKFRSSPKKDFFNTIGAKRTSRQNAYASEVPGSVKEKERGGSRCFGKSLPF